MKKIYLKEVHNIFQKKKKMPSFKPVVSFLQRKINNKNKIK